MNLKWKTLLWKNNIQILFGKYLTKGYSKKL